MGDVAGLTIRGDEAIRAIRTLLSEVYRERDGRTVLRELVQNADDAEATQIVFGLHDGFAESPHPLLRSQALVVANDGPLRARDVDAMRQSAGGSKAADVEKVGRFGLGQKSVFHLCEAFYFVGSGPNGVLRGGVDPWIVPGAGTVAKSSRSFDLHHPTQDGLAILDELRRFVLGQTNANDAGLLLWIPLRQEYHCRPQSGGGLLSLSSEYWTLEKAREWLGRDRQDSFALLLAQAGHLTSIRTQDELGNVLVSVLRQGAGLERPDSKQNDRVVVIREPASIAQDGSVREVTSVWVSDTSDPTLQEIRRDRAWPEDYSSEGGEIAVQPRKAAGHAAITLLPTPRRSQVVFRWAVFYPLNDDPSPNERVPSVFVSRGGTGEGWELVLHGYFLPTQDRQGIPGAFGDGSRGAGGHGSGSEGVRARWNQGVRDRLLLPLFPEAIERATESRPFESTRALVAAVRSFCESSDLGDAAWSREWLLPVLTADAAEWRRVPAAGELRGVTKWSQAPDLLRGAWMDAFPTSAGVIDSDSKALAPRASPWLPSEVQALLQQLPSEALDTEDALGWLDGWLRGVREEAGPEDAAAHDAVLARWWRTRLRKSHVPDTKGAGDDSERIKRQQESWRNLLYGRGSIIPIDVPRGTREVCGASDDSVFEAGDRVILLIPFGVKRDNRLVPDEPSVLIPILMDLGIAIQAGRLQRSERLLLADSLVGFMPASLLTDSLKALPLVRGRETRGKKYVRDVELSLNDLLAAGRGERLLFRSERTSDDDTEEVSETATAISERARSLAKALDRPVVRVATSVLTEGTTLPWLTADAIEDAVGSASSLSGDAPDRLDLLRHVLSEQRYPRPETLRSLLSGWPASEVNERQLLKTTESVRDIVELLLARLGRSQDLVPSSAVDEFSQKQLEPAQLVAASLETLAVELASSSHYEIFSDDEAELLLVGLAPEGSTWVRLAIHRRWKDGKRVAMVKGAALATDSLELPEGLELGDSLLAPLPESLDRYRSLAKADEDWFIERALSGPDKRAVLDYLLSKDPAALTEGSRARLRETHWLPTRQGVSAYVPPSKLIFSPNDPNPGEAKWHTAVRNLHDQGGLGSLHLDEELDLRPEQLLSLSAHWRGDFQAAFDQMLGHVSFEAAGEREWRILPNRQLWQKHRELLARRDFSSVSAGWKLITAIGPLVAEAELDAKLDRLVPKLVGEMSATPLVKLLKEVEQQAAPLDSPDGALFCDLLEAASTRDDFTRGILPPLKLMTRAGRKVPASEIARVSEGVALTQILAPKLRKAIRLGDLPTSVSHASSVEEERLAAKQSVDRLRSYFELAEAVVERKPIACFLNLLIDLRQRVTGTISEHRRRAIEALRPFLEAFTPGDVDVHQEQCRSEHADYAEPVWVDERLLVEGNQVELLNLLDQPKMFEVHVTDSILAAGSPARFKGGWSIRLRKVEWSATPPDKAREWIRNAAHNLAQAFPWLDAEKFEDYWRAYAEGSQETIGPTRRLIDQDLRLLLRHLGLSTHELFRDCIHEIEAGFQREDLRRASKAQADLVRLLESPDTQNVVLEKVRKKLGESSYDSQSVLFELFQNADDAYLPLKPGSDEFHVIRRPHEYLDVRHWGRRINDTLGDKGTDWGRDLYAMLCTGLTSKTTEPREGVAEPTGRFGLGFKSVYFLTDQPLIRSGELTVKVVAGLLPVALETTDGLPEVDDRPLFCTQLVLPASTDQQKRAQREAMDAFSQRALWLVAFAQRVQRIRLPGDEVVEFRVDDSSRDEAWTEHERQLRWRPRDLYGATGAALLVPLDQQYFADVPTFWNVTPTRDVWNLGYCINARFKLDPGRTGVVLDHPDTHSILESMGERLGKDLCELHDRWSASRAFDLLSVWHRLSSGITQNNTAHQGFLRKLHGRTDEQRRGLSAWAFEREIAPTGLPSPWRESLPRLSSVRDARVASGALRHDDALTALAPFASRLPILITADAARVLEAIGYTSVGEIKAVGCLSKVVSTDVTPELAFDLRGLAAGAVWSKLEADESESLKDWQRGLKFRSEAGSFRPARDLLVGTGCDVPVGDDSRDELEEERLRARLAPPENRLHSDYKDGALFRKVRDGLHAPAATIVTWLKSGHCTIDAIRDYLTAGRLWYEVLDELKKSGRPVAWARSLIDFRDTFKRDMKKQELVLFPDQFAEVTTRADTAMESADLRESIEGLWRQWNDSAFRKSRLQEWHSLHYPVSWSQSRIRTVLEHDAHRDEKEAWLLLLALSLCATKYARPEQHRSAIQHWMDKGYWQTMVSAETPKQWTDLLEQMTDEQPGSGPSYIRWMELVPYLYIAWRWYEVYRVDLRSVSRAGWSPVAFLNPDTNSAYQLGGLDAPDLPWPSRSRRWLVRELSRLGLATLTRRIQFYGFCGGAPVLRHLGLSDGARGDDVHRVIEQILGEERTAFHGCFDIPMFLAEYNSQSAAPPSTEEWD